MAAVIFLSSAVANTVQSFSIYIPYADTTMLSRDCVPHVAATISAHWLCTALYSVSPVVFAMLAPDVKLVVAHIAFISPAISNVPAVDSDLLFVFASTELIPARVEFDADVSLAFVAAISPAVDVSMALTSAAVFVMADIFRSLKSWISSDVCDSTFSRDCISANRDEQMHRRYVSFCFAQN